MLSDTLKHYLGAAIKRVGYEDPQSFEVTIPKEHTHGHYATAVALSIAKANSVAPMTVALAIAAACEPDESFKKITPAPPGFLNITLSDTALIAQAFSPQALASNKPSERIIIEFTDPNPFKEFHIGHLYSNMVGESLARMLAAGGHTVRRVCYQGDVGMHVASSVWGMIQEIAPLEDAATILTHKEKTQSLADRVKWLGACYARGATAYKTDEKVNTDIKTLNGQIFMSAQTMHKKRLSTMTPVIDYTTLAQNTIVPQEIVSTLYETGRRWTLEYFETIYSRLGTAFDDYYFESEVGEYGYALVKAHIADGIFEESEGAVVFKGEPYGLHTRVVINAQGLPTYECKELGLHPKKYADWPFDRSIVVTGNEIAEYFKVMMKALSLINPTLAAQTHHVPHGMVRLPTGKMSSRTGKVLSGEWLLDEVKKNLEVFVRENTRIPTEQKDSTLDRLAVAAVKYSFLKSNVGKDITFDLEDAVSFEGNSGPYILYTIVRCRSILTKAGTVKVHTPRDMQGATEHDLHLLSILAQAPDVILAAREKLAPHIMCTYAHILAQTFNSYYDAVNILKSENEIKAMRLALVTRTAETMTHLSHLIGFEVVDSM